MSLRIAWVGTFLLAISVPVRADDLDYIMARDRIASQKLQSDAEQAMASARAAESADPTRAVRLLEDALGQVKNSSVLAPQDRQALTQRLEARLRDANSARRLREADAAARPTAAPPGSLAPSVTRSVGPMPAENLADAARKTIDRNAAQVTTQERIRNNIESTATEAITQARAEATPGNGAFLEYPKDWAQKSEARKKFVAQTTPKEDALFKELDKTISVDFQGATLREALDYLMEKSNQPIIVDGGSLREARVDMDTAVTLKVKNVTFRTVLKKILGDQGLGYVVKDGLIQVLTAERASMTMTTRVYTAMDLLDPRVIGDKRWEPIYAELMRQVIITSVEPTIWSDHGGPASIVYSLNNHAFVVRAPAEVIYQMGVVNR